MGKKIDSMLPPGCPIISDKQVKEIQEEIRKNEGLEGFPRVLVMKFIEENHQNLNFSVTFIKKDGTIREMTARLGVYKYVKGVGLAFEPKELDLLVVYDMGLAAASGGSSQSGKGELIDESFKPFYRMININTLIRLKIRGKEYRITD